MAAHRAYLHSLQSACFLLLDRTWRLLDAAVQSLLNLVLVYCQLQRAKMDPVQVRGDRHWSIVVCGVSEDMLATQRTRRHTMRLVDEQLLTIGQEFRDKHRYLLKVCLGTAHCKVKHCHHTAADGTDAQGERAK